jgi:Protein of unknown function (DUF1579)
VDICRVDTKPFEGTADHHRLQRLVGDYGGTAKTWLEPGKPPAEAPWEGRIESILGGRFVRFEYQSSLFGDPFAGMMILGLEKDREQYQFTWIDSFHMGTGTMLSTGPAVPAGEPINVRGTWYVKQTDETWGWRTEIDDSGEGTLVIRMYIATPAGEEALGVEIALKPRNLL